MTGLVAPCRRCGRQVDSGQLRNGLCLDCRVHEAVASLRAEHARLWRKRERYRSAGGNVESIGRQIARVEDRMAAQIRGLVASDRQAAEYLKKELEEARDTRYLIGGT